MCKETFKLNDIIPEGSLMHLLNKFIGFDSFRKTTYTLLLMIVPNIILALCAYYEGNLWLGSVTSTHSSSNTTVVGMSFLGDTMVWPFTMLIPLAFILYVNAAKSSINLLNRLTDLADSTSLKDSDEINKTIKNTKFIIQLSYKYIMTTGKNTFASALGHLVRRPYLLGLFLPYLLAMTLWGYNTSTCAFHEYLPEKYYPYKQTITIKLQNNTEVPEVVEQPKWDCDISQAPVSTVAARVWTLFFYGVSPILLFWLAKTIIGVSYFMLRLKQLIGRDQFSNEEAHLLLKPFSDDDYGGLGFISETGMSYFYSVFIYITLVMMAFLKEGSNPSIHNYILMILYCPTALLVAAVPFYASSRILTITKSSYINNISNKINAYSDNNFDIASLDQSSKHELYSGLQTQKLYYDEAKKIPVWAFSYPNIAKIAVSYAVPLFTMLFEKWSIN